MEKEKLIEEAFKALENSYSPYSNYPVGAALLTADGHVIYGANIENASYPAGICAERNAIHHAAAMGERRLIAVAVVGGPDCHDAGDLPARHRSGTNRRICLCAPVLYL